MRAGLLDDIAGRLYDAVVDPALWVSLLSDLADASGSNGASYMVSDVGTGASKAYLSRYVDAAVLGPFHAYYAAINPLLIVDDIAAYRAAYQPTMLRDEEWMDRATLEHSEYFADFLRPLDAYRGLYLRLRLQDRTLTSISLSRGREQEHFTTGDMARLTRLHRHAIRAAALGDRFADLDRFATGATAAIDAVDDALLMLDADRQIVHLNAAAERLLAAGTLLDGSFGRVVAANPRLAGDLATAIERASPPGERAGSSITLISVDGVRTGRADILPIGVDAALDAARGPAVLLRIGALRQLDGARARLDQLDLTPAERALVLLLLDGRTLREAGAARGVSVNTARRQLASVFDKTGVHRQVELIRLLTRAA